MTKALLALLLLALAAAAYADTPLAPLPKLPQPIVVDGDLRDWQGAVSVPVWTESDICFAASGYQWRGPADVSLEAYCAWSTEGLCLAIVVADDVVENLRTDWMIFLEDSIELYLDGRRPEVQATSPYTKGAYQIMITPPLPGHPAEVVINDRDGTIPDLKMAAAGTPTGYIIEALIPWSAFPELTPRPGAQVAFNFAVNDYDGRDRLAERPGQLNRDGAKLMWEHPEGCLKWKLVESLDTPEGTNPSPFVAFETSHVAMATMPLRFVASVGTLLSPRVGSIQFTAADWQGKPFLNRTVHVSPAPAPWTGAVQGVLDWPDDVTLRPGIATITATANDWAGLPLGAVTRRVFIQEVPGASGRTDQ